MTQKCDGVKILDLEEKLEATGGEYIVTAEKDNNYKLPLESVADIVIGNSKFKLDSTGMRMGQAQFPFTEWFGLNSNGSGQLAKGNIAWNSSGEINELNVGDSANGKVVLAGDSFSGLRVPQTTDTDFYLIDIYGSQNTTPKSGTIYVRSSNGSQIYISGDGSIYVQKVSGGNTYSASLDPTVGLVFKKNSATTKTYANA